MAENFCLGQEPEDVARIRTVSAVFKNGQLENITKLGQKRSALSIEEMSKLKNADSFKKKKVLNGKKNLSYCEINSPFKI